MHLAPDTDANLQFAAMVCNTVSGATRSGEDELSTVAQLDALLEGKGFTGRIDHDAAEVAEVRAMRDRVRNVWTMERDEMVAHVNAMLVETSALPQLERHDDLDWHIHATPGDAPLAQRILTEVAMALVDVIRSDQQHRLRACAAYDCDGLLADQSRNGSKLYCSVRCSNRMNMVAFRERAADDATPTPAP